MTKTTNIPQGYKNSPLGIIPEEWEVKRLVRVSDFKAGYAFDSKKFLDNGKYQVVKMSNLYNGVLDLERSKSFINELPINASDAKLKSNEILITLTGTIGKRDYGYSYQIKENSNLLLNQRVGKLIPLNISPTYLYYFINTKKFLDQFFISSRGGTGNQANVGVADVLSIKIALPPLPEQQKIAEILSTWDAAIEKQNTLIQQLELRKRGLMQQLLTGRLRLRNATGERFEEEWKKVKYSDIVKEVNRKLNWNDEELYDLISVRRRSGGLFQRESLYGKEIKTKNLRPAFTGDFLISKMQIVHGASGLTKQEFNNMKVSNSYITLIAKDQKVLNIEFFNLWSQVKRFYHQTFIASYGVHIEKMTFSLETFLTFGMLLPTLLEQTAIAEVLSTADKEIELEKVKLTALRNQKKGLMQGLLSGRVRVKI